MDDGVDCITTQCRRTAFRRIRFAESYVRTQVTPNAQCLEGAVIGLSALTEQFPLALCGDVCTVHRSNEDVSVKNTHPINYSRNAIRSL